MPDVAVSVFLALDVSSLWEATEFVPDDLVQIAQESMSEFDVLEMAQHDAHYAGGAMQPLATNQVVAPSFVKLSLDKTWAPNVTGNIGEGIGIATFLHLSGLGGHEVARIKRQKEKMPVEAKRTPDFVAFTLSQGGGADSIRKLLELHLAEDVKARATSLSALRSFPDRFPIETKGTMKASGPSLWSGLWQLIEYWYSCTSAPATVAEVGYGVLICTTDIGATARSVSLRLFMPRDQAKFQICLAQLVDTRASRDAYQQQFANLEGAPFVRFADLA